MTGASSGETPHRTSDDEDVTAWLERVVPLGLSGVGVGVALVSGILVGAAYVQTANRAAGMGGLFYLIADQIVASGGVPPARIPYYTEGGLPMAYPPLGFYLIAGLSVVGVGTELIALVLPSVLIVAGVPFSFDIGRRLGGDWRHGTILSIITATSPTILAVHQSADGVPRVLGFLFALAGFSAWLRVLDSTTHRRRWTVLGGIAFGLVVLTHPVVALFYGVSCLALYLVRDRSVRGFLLGAGMFGCGLVLALPWLVHTVSLHGVEPFLNAASSRPSKTLLDSVPAFIGGQRAGILPLGKALIALGGVYALIKRRTTLLVWFGVTATVIGTRRFLMFVGGIMSAVFVIDGLVPVFRSSAWQNVGVSRRHTSVVGVVAIVGFLVVSGVHFAVTMQTGISQREVSTVQQVGDTTPADATFLVVAPNEEAEWFPYYAERTIILSPWGTEWIGTHVMQKRLYHRLQTCQSVECLTQIESQVPGSAEYVYLSTNDAATPTRRLVQSLRDAGGEIVFRNDVAVVIELPTAESQASVGTDPVGGREISTHDPVSQSAAVHGESRRTSGDRTLHRE